MDIKLFRAVTPYIVRGKRPDLSVLTDLCASYEARDPSGGQWVAGGFVPVDGDETAVDVQGAALMIQFQLNQRNLPGPVIREHMVKRIADLASREDRKLTKKELAEVRDEVELDLLPKSFIRRKFVPVMLVNNKKDDGEYFVFVFTSSAKLADDCCNSFLTGLSTVTERTGPVMARLENVVARSIDAQLTLIAKGESVLEPDTDATLVFNNSATLAGGGKARITVKEKDIGSAEVQALLQQEYSVSKLGLHYTNDGFDDEPDATLVLNDRLVITALECPGIQERDEDTFIGQAWIVARALHDLVHTLIEAMGGRREGGLPEGKDEKIVVPAGVKDFEDSEL